MGKWWCHYDQMLRWWCPFVLLWTKACLLLTSYERLVEISAPSISADISEHASFLTALWPTHRKCLFGSVNTKLFKKLQFRCVRKQWRRCGVDLRMLTVVFSALCLCMFIITRQGTLWSTQYCSEIPTPAIRTTLGTKLLDNTLLLLALYSMLCTCDPKQWSHLAIRA